MPMKWFTRRALVLAATSAVAALALAGYSRGEDVIDNAPAEGTIQFWIGGADAEKMPAFLADFEANNPGVKVEVTQIPSDQFDAKLLTAIAAGTVPDIVRLYSQSQASLMATGAFAPVPEGVANPDDFFANAYSTNVKGGVAYGKTDKDGTSVAENEVGVHELFGTLYKGLGIDPTPETNASVRDNLGRPYYLASKTNEPDNPKIGFWIKDLIG